MKVQKFCLVVVIISLGMLAGCQSGQRTEPVAGTVATTPEPAPPAPDEPQPPDDENPYIVTPDHRPHRPQTTTEQAASLIYHGELDLMRLLVCSEEVATLGSELYGAEELLQAVNEHFTDLGFRVLNRTDCPDYSAGPGTLAQLAKEADVDMYVLLQAEAEQMDKFGDFYSFSADGRAKVVQLISNELLTTKSASVRGKRALKAERAAQNALEKCGTELAEKLRDEIIRKSSRGMLVRRLRIDGLDEMKYVDYVRTSLNDKPGIRSVRLISWDEKTDTALYWIRLDASAKENLGAYLEQLKDIELRIERLDTTGGELHKKGWLEN